MKKLRKITLSKESLREIRGGEVTVAFNASNSKPASGCGCNCQNCSWEDGGGGFAVGMIYAKI